MLITILFAIKWALLTYFGHYNGHEKKINNVNGPISFHLSHGIRLLAIFMFFLFNGFQLMVMIVGFDWL